MYCGRFLGLRIIEVYFRGKKSILNKVLDKCMIYSIKRLLETEDHSGTINPGLLMHTHRCIAMQIL